MSSDNEIARRMAEDLAEIERTCMPYGKFGPQFHPPSGVPIYDLPAEYLSWFAHKPDGFPKGKLGRLMEIVYHMKADGSDMAFEPMRRRAGGRVSLRTERQRSFEIGDA